MAYAVQRLSMSGGEVRIVVEACRRAPADSPHMLMPGQPARPLLAVAMGFAYKCTPFHPDSSSSSSASPIALITFGSEIPYMKRSTHPGCLRLAVNGVDRECNSRLMVNGYNSKSLERIPPFSSLWDW
jgi:hypothetical protein